MGSVYNRGTKAKPRYYMLYRELDGHRVNYPTHQRTKEDAERVCAACEERVRQGQVGLPPRKSAKEPRLTVRVLGDRFSREYAPSKIVDIEEFRVDVRSILKRRIYPWLGEISAEDLTLDRVEEHCRRLQQPGAKKNGGAYEPGSVRGAIRVLSRMYNWGRRKQLLTCANPCSGMEPPPPAGRVEDYLGKDDPEEPWRLLAYAEAMAPYGVYVMIAVAILMGLRKGELFGLRWENVFWGRPGRGAVEGLPPTLYIRHSYDGPPKGKRPRDLEMHPDVIPLLRAWQPQCPKTAQGLVFPVHRQRKDNRQSAAAMARWSASKELHRMGEESDMLGLRDLLTGAGCHQLVDPWHCLRHTFAVEFLVGGGDIHELKELLGHSTIKVTEEHYAHLAPRKMRGKIGLVRLQRPADSNVTPISSARKPPQE